MYRYIYLLVLALFVSATTLYASSVFKVSTPEIEYIAKSMSVDNGAVYVVTNPRGAVRKVIPNGFPATSWHSKYASITFNQLSGSLPTGGINQQGLVVELIESHLLFLPEGVNVFNLNEFETVQYLLDNCSNVQESLDILSRIKILPISAPFHLFLSDDNGASAIVDFLEGEMVVVKSGSDNYLPILAINDYATATSKVVDFDSDKHGYEEFFSISKLPNDFTTATIFDVFKHIEAPKTRVNIIYNTSAKSVQFATVDFPAIKEISVSDIEMMGSESLYRSVNQLVVADDLKSEFSPISPDVDYRIMKNGFERAAVNSFTDEMLRELAFNPNYHRSDIFDERIETYTSLKIAIIQLTNSKGVVRVKLFDDETTFESGEYMRYIAAPISRKISTMVFYNIPRDGEYAISYYHDENSNDRLDRQWIGFAKEDYGFSGDGGDSFEDASFSFDDLVSGSYIIKRRRSLLW